MVKLFYKRINNVCKNQIPCLIISNLKYVPKEINYEGDYADLTNELNCDLYALKNSSDIELAFLHILKKVASIKIHQNPRKRMKKEKNKLKKRKRSFSLFSHKK